MKETERIEIQLSKTKLTLLFLGSIMFVATGAWYVINPPKVNISIFSNPTLVFIVGLASILFFGLVGFFIFKKLFDNAPGLIISTEGVFDNSSGVSVGFVPWTDIVEIKETKISNQKFINIVVKNPQEYIDKQKSAFKRKSLKVNYNSYGTVIGISANGLKIKYNDLKALFDKQFAEFNGKFV